MKNIPRDPNHQPEPDDLFAGSQAAPAAPVTPLPLLSAQQHGKRVTVEGVVQWVARRMGQYGLQVTTELKLDDGCLFHGSVPQAAWRAVAQGQRVRVTATLYWNTRPGAAQFYKRPSTFEILPTKS